MHARRRPTRGRRWGSASLAAAVFVALLGAVTTASAHPDRRASHDVFDDPVKWFVDPDSNAARQAAAWLQDRPADAATMARLAERSQADWFVGGRVDVRSAARARVDQIRRQHALPVLVAYNVPGRDCSGFSTGGANTAAEYRDWIDRFAEGIGSRPAAVILEPDSIALTECLTPEQTDERYELIRYAVGTLEARPRVAVYLDAGHSAWQPAAEQAARLRRAGVERAQGFFLNVSNFQFTSDLIAYGHAVSDLIGARGGTQFVIDTSRNGLGPWDPTVVDNWCNPPDRALGLAATTDTGDRLVDAFLWVKRPGESDGTCRGGPLAGVWWPEYALGLAQRAGL
jgi:endoglucanase